MERDTSQIEPPPAAPGPSPAGPATAAGGRSGASADGTMDHRTVAVLQVVAVLAILILSLALAPWLARGEIPDRQVAGSGAAILLGLLCLVLLRTGRHRAGVLALAGAVWAHVAWPMLTLGLSHALMGTRFAILPLAMVALLLGRRDLWATCAAFGAAAVLGAARDAGWLGGSPQPTLMPTRPLLSTLVLFLLAALLLDRLVGSLRSALAEALRGNQALREREQMREQLRQAQKMEAIGRLAGGVAHDFNNVLTSILGTASLAAEGLPPDHPARADLDQVQADGQRAAELTRQLLLFARKEVVTPRLVRVDERVGAMARMLHRVLGERVLLETHLAAGEATVRVDPAQLEQVVLNLAVNARDAMPAGGRLLVATATRGPGEDGLPRGLAGPGRWVVLSVRDEGAGISADVLPRIFEPFFTTKGPEQGTGLGLATCHGIVTQAGGEILVESQPGVGTCFHVCLPEAFGEADRAEAPVAVARGGTETILLVEDQEPVRSMAARVLRSRRYRVLEAHSVASALQAAAAHPGAIDLLLLDVGLPDGSGRAVADALRLTRPGARVLYTSGHPEDEVVRRGVADASVRDLRKPFAAEQLAQAVRGALEEALRPAGLD